MEDVNKSLELNVDEETLALQREAEKVKAQFNVKRIFMIEVDSEGDNEKGFYRAWLRKPDLKVLGAFFELGQSNPIAASKMVFNECFLTGDNEITQDDEIFAGAMSQLEELMKTRQAKLVKF
jgi:hypothetical protein